VKKVLKNLISSVLPQIVNIISNLILPGLIIAQFGSDVNGLVSTTKTVISYISLVGAGIATAVTQALYQPVANKDDNAVKGMLRSANGMFNRYGAIFVIITFCVAIIYPFAIQSDIPHLTVAGLLIVMSISGASEFFAIGRCRALLYAHQKVYVCSLIQAVSLLFSLLLAVFMLKINTGIIAVQFSVSFVYVMRGFLLTSYIKRNYPQYSDYKKADPVDAAIQKRKDAMVHQLAGLAVTGSQSAILTLLVDLKAASIYSVYNIVLYGIKTICSNLCTAITPFLGKKYALNLNHQLRKMYNIVEFSFFSLVTFVLSVTVATLVPFVGIYTKSADMNYIYPTFAVLFVISSAFYILKLPGTALINVAGHFKETKWRALLEAGLSVVLSVAFTLLIGKNGVLLGTAVALGWRCIDTVVYAAKKILKASYKRTLLRLGVFFVDLAFFKVLSDRVGFIPANYGQWILMAVVFSAIAGVVLLLEALVFERDTIKQIVSYIKKHRISNGTMEGE